MLKHRIKQEHNLEYRMQQNVSFNELTEIFHLLLE